MKGSVGIKVKTEVTERRGQKTSMEKWYRQTINDYVTVVIVVAVAITVLVAETVAKTAIVLVTVNWGSGGNNWCFLHLCVRIWARFFTCIISLGPHQK